MLLTSTSKFSSAGNCWQSLLGITFSLLCHPNFSTRIAQFCILKPSWHSFFLYISSTMIPPQNPRQVKYCWSSPPSRQCLKDNLTATCVHACRPGDVSPTNVAAADKENATVIKHVMGRSARRSLIPAEVNCKRFCQILSLVLPSCKCPYSP